MILTVNGKQESIEKSMSLDALIAAKGLCPEKVVVEHNFRIVSKEDWPKVTVAEKDMIEIVSFVGGG